MIGIRLALSPVAVTGSTCTTDHPYYPSCEEPNWTATPVTVYPTASENDMPDTDPPIQIPTQNATNIAELTGTPTPSPYTSLLASALPQTNNSDSAFDTMATSTPTATLRIVSRPTSNDTQTVQMTPIIIDDSNVSFTCQRYDRVTIRGTTDPYSLILVTFDKRVVGGGISYATGTYAVPLVIGDEASGTHHIDVLQRNTNKLIKRMTCLTP